MDNFCFNFTELFNESSLVKILYDYYDEYLLPKTILKILFDSDVKYKPNKFNMEKNIRFSLFNTIRIVYNSNEIYLIKHQSVIFYINNITPTTDIMITIIICYMIDNYYYDVCNKIYDSFYIDIKNYSFDKKTKQSNILKELQKLENSNNLTNDAICKIKVKDYFVYN